jgi:putative endonuclease
VLSRTKTNSHYRAGIWAEYIAALYLLFNGYRILKFRYKTKVGEIDVITKKGATYCFVEVKYRQSLSDAVAAVSAQSQSRIRRAGEHYLLGKGIESPSVRFDVIGLTPQLKIRHEKNAF